MTGMVIGIIFIAHHYYHIWGGQGFLKPRASRLDGQAQHPRVYLPIRPMAKYGMNRVGLGQLKSKRLPKNVAFDLCGDQENSCGNHGQPVCFIADFTSA
jgi:hypothetical protein